MAETNISFLQECVDVTRPTQKEKKIFLKSIKISDIKKA